MACDSARGVLRDRNAVPETTNTVFIYRSLVARSALRTVDLAMDVAGGAAYFRKVGLERLFRDIQGARFHPLTDSAQRRLAGRTALGLSIEGSLRNANLRQRHNERRHVARTTWRRIRQLLGVSLPPIVAIAIAERLLICG